jgi:DNA-binding transcriptional LysR family regulator
LAVTAEAVAPGGLQYVLEDWMLRSSPLCLNYAHNRNTLAALRALMDTIRTSG